jgi:hypothetical protein
MIKAGWAWTVQINPCCGANYFRQHVSNYYPPEQILTLLNRHSLKLS